ncbi:methyltransferase domain-containing protein [Tessaracoccus antarcticus]|uniref:Methyltransferase domain-containing protein n=2 Tax=Tessaracoccus antarcticus TaxID=2479848 RepID=A0A3M0GJF3_9ACTN|nr:methyltransferase domain-containing protein [Tessaracoccus antarcticus]
MPNQESPVSLAGMTNPHTHHSHPPHTLWSELPEGLADHLDLEATLSQPVLQIALDEAASTVTSEPSLIVDLGAGTGVGTVALASRFPTAQIHSIDISPQLLERLGAASVAAGVADRVHAHRVDLDGDWYSGLPRKADLVWAALSLHHVSNPAEVLRRAFEALRPGGLLVLTEMTGTPRFEPGDLGSGRDGLADRLTTNSAAHGSRATLDWSALLDQVGFAPIRHHQSALRADAVTGEGARYLARHLRSRRAQLVEELPMEDLRGLDTAIESIEADMSEVSFTSGRGVWVVARPELPVLQATAASDAAQPVTADRASGRQSSLGKGTIKADVVVVGGGSAGLAAAIALARSRRSVVVIDAGHPRNAPAEGAHNVLGQEGVSPLELLARGRAEAESYGVQIIQGRAARVLGSVDDFTIETDHGAHRVHARRIILATGLVDDLPAIPGVEQAWGRTVLHCPFCHGWEVRDQRIAILTGAEIAVHHVMMFRQLSEHVTLFLHEAADPTEEQSEQLAALNVPVIRTRVERLIVDGTQVQAVEVEGGSTFDTDAVVIAPRFNARTELFEALGGQREATPFGQQIPTDPRGMTAVPGVWAAGNASQQMAMVMASAASGVMAGSAVHGDLGFADLNRAVQTRRDAALADH